MKQETAETVALKALAWLVGNEELLPVFLGSTGASIDELQSRATDPEFLGSVLDFLTMDDSWVTEFCDSAKIACEDPMAARQSLPGGALPNWT